MVQGYGNYDKYPAKEIKGFTAVSGYDAIVEELK